MTCTNSEREKTWQIWTPVWKSHKVKCCFLMRSSDFKRGILLAILTACCLSTITVTKLVRNNAVDQQKLGIITLKVAQGQHITKPFAFIESWEHCVRKTNTILIIHTCNSCCCCCWSACNWCWKFWYRSCCCISCCCLRWKMSASCCCWLGDRIKRGMATPSGDTEGA